MSILLHGGIAAFACVSVLPRGGGSSAGAGTGLEAGASGVPSTVLFRGSEETLEASHVDDVAVSRIPISDDPPPVEISDPPSIPFDPFVTETNEGVEVSKIPPSSGEVSARFSSSSERFERLPSTSSAGGEGLAGSGIAAGGSGANVGKGAGSGSGVGDGAGDAVALYRPRPVYPTEARRKSLEGSVFIEFTVESDGTCSDIKIAESSGIPMLDEAALRAVREWRYKPAEADGRAVATARSIRIVFKIDP